ncbi:tetratricopeptide-like helical [Fusarium pseudocircinatum]|uniref:Tetratricopeptide-like helical n=1 Tax=Fusarium pseudocircinatum TaxID=56676 RepID=A0A8H5LDS9_9HYPO|nr:tetratricopeptide-like helical [Fusarium pseudocircinatum]
MEQAYEDAKYVVDLIPQMAVRSLESSDKQDLLLKIGGVSSEAAGLALHLGEDPLVALSLLEKGRGIFALSLDEMRADIRSLEEQCPDLTRKFITLREHISASSASGRILNPEDPECYVDESRRHEAGDELERLIGEIRQQAGFETFLLPPSEAGIKSAAERGPIVKINTSMLRCDAILVESHQITSVPLTGFNRRLMIEYVRNGTFRSDEALQWLWNGVASPVLNALGFDKPASEGDWPHVWWIMTGLLNKFPIHAAGHHLKGSSETKATFFSFDQDNRTARRDGRHSWELKTPFRNEGIHLINGFHTAGFRHVIGTLWEVKDEICVDMARITYQGMAQNGMTDEAVSRGLYEASRELRDRWLTLAGTDRRAIGISHVGTDERERVDVEELEETGLDRSSRDVVTCDEEPMYSPWIPYIHYGV